MGDESDTSGHRGRLRQRLLADPDGLLDHELVEYLLALVILRRDTKTLAMEFLKGFGGIASMPTASSDAIAAVKAKK
jgi:DNA repair protein RadC